MFYVKYIYYYCIMIFYFNIVYPIITNSDDEDVNDATWLPPSILTPSERISRRQIKCLYPKVEKSLPKKKNCKSSNVNKDVAIKRLVCCL